MVGFVQTGGGGQDMQNVEIRCFHGEFAQHGGAKKQNSTAA